MQALCVQLPALMAGCAGGVRRLLEHALLLRVPRERFPGRLLAWLGDRVKQKEPQKANKPPLLSAPTRWRTAPTTPGFSSVLKSV